MSKKLFNYAVRLLARRRYHSVALRKKLKEKNIEDSTDQKIEEIIEKLNKLKYINDREYLNLYIQDQLQRKPQGKRLIRMRLIQKGIPKEEIEKTLNGYSIDEYELANRAAMKKIKVMPTTTPRKQKEKLYRFLISRGFDPKTIQKILDNIFTLNQ